MRCIDPRRGFHPLCDGIGHFQAVDVGNPQPRSERRFKLPGDQRLPFLATDPHSIGVHSFSCRASEGDDPADDGSSRKVRRAGFSKKEVGRACSGAPNIGAN